MDVSGISGWLPEVENFSKDSLMRMEKEMLGVYISEHPLEKYIDIMKRCGMTSTDKFMPVSSDEEGEEGIAEQLSEVNDGDVITVGGIINNVKTLINKTTALMLAAEWTEVPEVVNVLLQAGAKIDARDDEGATTLMQSITCKAKSEVLSIEDLKSVV